MTAIRKEVVAGAFYPDDSQQLKMLIGQFMDQVSLPLTPPTDTLGIISPHAGYVFSGQCAAYGFKAIKDKKFDVAVILAPSHSIGGFEYSVGKFDAYRTPLGDIEVELDLTEQLLADADSTFDPYAHHREHSLEVQLPFLQVIKPEAKILPVLIGNQHRQCIENLSKKLISLLSGRMDKTVFIVSSDLSHYHNAAKAEKLDKKLIAAIEELDTELFWNLIRQNEAEACGFAGILTVMNIAKQLNYDKAKNLCYTHSGETGGDFSQVVGYVSTLLYK